ncbi:MAG: ABC transporter ATP-binding protein, partial [Candidatus Nanopelagicales bacterium]
EQGQSVTLADGYLEVAGSTCAAIGDLAAQSHLTIHELFEDKASLEEAFMEMTKDSVEYHTDSVEAASAGK